MRLLALLFLLSLPILTPALAQESATQPTGTIAVDDSSEQDAAIATRIRDILGELEGYDDVTVTVASGIVTLRGQTADIAKAASLAELVGRVEGVVAIDNQVIESTDLAERLNPAVERFQKRIVQTIAFLPLLLIAGAVFVVILTLGWFIARLRYPWDRIAPNAFIANIYRQIVFILFAIGGLVVALDILNATALLSTILGAAGIIGLAIGFAVRDTVENFIASIMLSIRQPFRPNDAVEINGDEGKVIRLTSRATILLSYDGNHIRIPNATVFKSRIVNFTTNDERRFKFQVGVEPDSDLAKVRDLMEKTVADLPFTLEQPGITVWIEDLTDSGVIFTLTGWIDQRKTSLLRARGEALRLVKDALEREGFSIPDTTYRIRLDGGPHDEVAVSSTTATKAKPKRKTPKPAPAAPVQETGVDTKEDEALERMIHAERSDEENPDLLSTDAPKE